LNSGKNKKKKNQMKINTYLPHHISILIYVQLVLFRR